jgi:hypothetical protein
MDKFDWIFYLNRYPELYNKGVFNYETAIKHWYEYGINEGKQYNNLSYKISKKNINIVDTFNNTNNIEMFNDDKYECVSIIKPIKFIDCLKFKNDYILDPLIKVYNNNDPNTLYSNINIIDINNHISLFENKEIINMNIIDSFILLVDFPRWGGGTSFFLDTIISNYKNYNTFLILRNINNKIILNINDEYDIDYTDIYTFLNENKDKIIKIFVNHIIGHSTKFFEFIFNLKKDITTITHDLNLIYNTFQINYIDLPNYYNTNNFNQVIDINNFSTIITQNIGNLNIFDKYIYDKNKIVISPLPDFKNSYKKIACDNSKIVIGIIGRINFAKGSSIYIEIINYYKNNDNIKIIFFGKLLDYNYAQSYPYKDINELNKLLEIHKPNIIIESSIWPETYSYTLTLSMLTQLPILYLKKTGNSTVENRLNDYNKAYPFASIIELDYLIKTKRQNYLYTIEPNIYYNKYWDNYFYKSINLEYKSNIEYNIISNNIINKNIVFITSKIYTSNTQLTYSNIRSKYTPKERFEQTINTINSIKKYIPDYYIILFDNSTFNEEEYNILNSNVNLFINIINNDTLNYYTNNCKYKFAGELYQQLYAYYILFSKINLNNINHFFKISGRYFINKNFDYKIYNNKLNIFKQYKELKDRNYYYTSFYKLNKEFLNEYFDKLIYYKNNKFKYLNKDFEVVFHELYESNITLVDTQLGITQIIAPTGQVNNI